MASQADSKTILPTAMPSQLYTTHPQNIGVPVPCQKKGPLRRFLRAILFTAFGWLLIRASKGQFHHNSRWHWIHDTSVQFTDEGWYYDIPSNLKLEDCVTGENWGDEERQRFPYSSVTAFDVPIADTLFLVSRGQLSGGILTVVSSVDQSADSATVKITAKYYRDDIRDLAKACLTSREEGENGIGIFTPTWHHGHSRRREDMMYFETLVILPEGSDEASPFSIKNFETDVPNTAQSVEDLSKTFFDSIQLTASNGPITVESLHAARAIVSTRNGPIRGMFNTSVDLSLLTSNSPINVSVGMHSDGIESVTLIARTTNGPLGAEISTFSSRGRLGSFDITTTTTNSALSIGFPVAPVESKLQLKASTSNSPAKVFLHPAYEGTFDLKTSSIFRSGVIVDESVIDPSGQDRKRRVSFSTVGKGHLLGEVGWQETGKTTYQGEVSISTTNSPITLYL